MASRDSGVKVRRSYDERPYPSADETALTNPGWRIAPLKWINAVWRPGRETVLPRRILVAGCGAGSEAFALRRRLPGARIVAVDFSPRLIALARRLARSAPEMRGIRFVVADLASPQLAAKIGRGFDSISCHDKKSRLSAMSAAYLGGDLFGSIIHNLPLAEWLRIARIAGLNLRGCHSCGTSLVPLCDRNLTRVLMPRSRAEFCELEEMLTPGSFHRLLFTHEATENPPWTEPDALLAWHPVRTRLHEAVLPARGRSWHALRPVRFTSTAPDTRIDLRIPEWEVEILRASDGARSLGDILGKIPATIPARMLREQLYLLYLLIVMIDLLPPHAKTRQ